MYTIPNYLKKGDKVAVISPAGKVNKELTESGIIVLKSWGLDVIRGKHLYSQYGSLAGTDEQRLMDIQRALDTEDVKAIFCSRGGYGCQRIIDSIDWSQFLKSPKWLVGFSDITALLMKVNSLHTACIHGAMVSQFVKPEVKSSADLLKDILFGIKAPTIKTLTSEFNHNGIGSGILIGGNLSLLASQVGTKSDIDYTGKILLIEEIGEYPYHIDRMLIQMKRAGKFNNINGLIVGQMTDIKENTDNPFPLNVNQIIRDTFKDYDYPIAYSFDIGHDYPNIPVILGKEVNLILKENSASLLYV